MDKEAAKKYIKKYCGDGWLTFVDIIYDNQPKHILITEVFQKYGSLEVRYKGEDENFDFIISNLNIVSQYICEVCGRSGGKTIIDGWDTTLCKMHFDESKAKIKFRTE